MAEQFLSPGRVETNRSCASGHNIPAKPYGFTGRRLDDETGLWYFRARYYDGELGRFVGRDQSISESLKTQAIDGSQAFFRFYGRLSPFMISHLMSGYNDGYGLYTAYFVPAAVDPTGHVRSSEMPDDGDYECVDCEWKKWYLFARGWKCCGDLIYDTLDIHCCDETRYFTISECCIEGNIYKQTTLWELLGYSGPYDCANDIVANGLSAGNALLIGAADVALKKPVGWGATSLAYLAIATWCNTTFCDLSRGVDR